MKTSFVVRLALFAIAIVGSSACAGEPADEEVASSSDALTCNEEQLSVCRRHGGGAACTSKWCTSSSQQGSNVGSVAGSSISASGRQQMRSIVSYASSHNSAASRGRCFEYVWRYLTSSGYGALDNVNDAPDMPSAYARDFAVYMNANGNAARWGLQRLAISNPYDAPVGSVVVVAAGSPGTAHPTAGDISIAAGGGRFINDGPNMSYGGSRAAFASGGGRVLGVYAPR